MMEAPRDPSPAPAGPSPAATYADLRLLGAFEAIGLSPEDLLGPPEAPEVAVTAASAALGLLDWGLERVSRFRAAVRGPPRLKVEQERRNVRPDFVRHQVPMPGPKLPPLVFTKKVVRSVYKLLLGVAIGILIWGMVRNTE
jgi:hypothetical protein